MRCSPGPGSGSGDWNQLRSTRPRPRLRARPVTSRHGLVQSEAGAAGVDQWGARRSWVVAVGREGESRAAESWSPWNLMSWGRAMRLVRLVSQALAQPSTWPQPVSVLTRGEPSYSNRPGRKQFISSYLSEFKAHRLRKRSPTLSLSVMMITRDYFDDSIKRCSQEALGHVGEDGLVWSEVIWLVPSLRQLT